MTINDAPPRRPFVLLRPEALTRELRHAITHRELAAGETLYRRGDLAQSIFAIERGRLRLFSYTSEGKPVPLYLICAGECVSEAALFAEVYCGDVVAEVASRVAVFPKKALQAAFHEDSMLAAEFMKRLTVRFNLLRIRLEIRNVLSARERILQYLALSVPPGHTVITLDRPLKSIADDIGLSHESFYRTFTALIKERVITRNKSTISFQPVSGDRSPRG